MFQNLRDLWNADRTALLAAMRPGAGFSLIYDGTPQGPDLSQGWHSSGPHSRGNADLSETTWTHPSGLQITREVRTFNPHRAIEYRLRLRNTSDQALPPLSALHALHVALGEPALEGSCVISSGGGLHDTLMPPRGFALRRHCFQSKTHADLSLELTTQGGRSSSQDLPFFFLQNDRLGEGLFVAFGWSGQWALQIRLDRKAGVLTLRGKIPELHIALEPGEEIEGPSVLIGAYRGSVHDGANHLRRLIGEAYTPRRGSSRAVPVAAYSNWYDLWGEFNEAQLKRTIDAVAPLGQEVFILDAGWYAGASEADGGFSSGLGNWNEVDRRKLPDGLKPIAEYVRAKGLEFGLWFEPERVIDGSELARAHPEWILWKRTPQPASWMQEIMPEHPFFKQRFGILDLGRPEVQDWVCSMIDGYIQQYGIKYIRHDFNIDPLAYWDANDAPDRRGITQIRYIHGLYRILDRLRARHPGTIFEGCASGGLRIDLEMARRSHAFWISDNHVDPDISHFHLQGINYFLPGNYNFVTYIRPLRYTSNPQAPPTLTDAELRDVDFQSLFGGAFGMGGRVDLWPQASLEQARRHVDLWKSLRRYLLEDYFPLTPQTGDSHAWSGWQFHDPHDQSGFMQVFRIEAPDATRHFPLHRLEPGAVYRFADPYSGRSMEITGAEATDKGIERTQPPRSSTLLTYQKLSNAGCLD